MVTTVLNSTKYLKKWSAFLLPAFLVLIGASCSDSKELTREKAAALISASYGYPRHEEVELQKLYTKDYERIVKSRPGTCLGYSGPKFNGKIEVALKQMLDKGLITITDEQQKGNNCITNFARIGLADVGRKYLLEESDHSYTLKASDIVIDQVSGIVRQKETPLALAEYTVLRDRQTPFFFSLDVFGKGGRYNFDKKRAALTLYDDGWRVIK